MGQDATRRTISPFVAAALLAQKHDRIHRKQLRETLGTSGRMNHKNKNTLSLAFAKVIVGFEHEGWVKRDVSEVIILDRQSLLEFIEARLKDCPGQAPKLAETVVATQRLCSGSFRIDSPTDESEFKTYAYLHSLMWRLYPDACRDSLLEPLPRP
jgi:hypothetical protein